MSVAVLHRQEVILARGFAVADVAQGIPASPIASLTKTFAAAVIMRLVEQGKLDLDEPMSRYDPDYAQWCGEIKGHPACNPPWARDYNFDSERITVRHHLTHTAQGKPGTAYQYNGSLFARLTAVIDALSPKGFNRAVEEDILVPLGMNDTALGTGDPNKAGVIARMARPYRLDADLKIVESNTFTPPLDYISAASGMISTVTDLARYDVAIDDGQVYSPQAKQQIWTAARSPTGEGFPYGLGWFVWEPLAKFCWHYGRYADAFSPLLFKVPDQQLTLILLACRSRELRLLAWPW